jgi:hypothetical protein
MWRYFCPPLSYVGVRLGKIQMAVVEMIGERGKTVFIVLAEV